MRYFIDNNFSSEFACTLNTYTGTGIRPRIIRLLHQQNIALFHNSLYDFFYNLCYTSNNASRVVSIELFMVYWQHQLTIVQHPLQGFANYWGEPERALHRW